MSDQNLRKAIIRLAHQKPELRGDLLPLLARSAAMMLDQPYKVRLKLDNLELNDLMALARAGAHLPVHAPGEWFVYREDSDLIYLARRLGLGGSRKNFLNLRKSWWETLKQMGLVETL